jgi:hypothetical protein
VRSLTALSHILDLDIPPLGNLMLGDGAFANFVDSLGSAIL